MAVKELFAVIARNFDIGTTVAQMSLHAGSLLALDPTLNQVFPAQRDSATYGGGRAAGEAGYGLGNGACRGVLTDDTARTGNTMIQIDPVGSTFVNPNTNLLVANNNGYYRVAKRAIGDFQSEPVDGVTNPTAGASGYEGPRRGVGCFTSQGTVLITDQFALYKTADTTNAYSGAVDAAFSGSDTFLVNDYLTYGTNAAGNAGLFVKVDPTCVYLAGRAVAMVDQYDAASGLLYIQLL